MKRLIAVVIFAFCGLSLTVSSISLDTFAQSGSPEASPVGSPAASPIASPVASPRSSPSPAALDIEGMILDLQATVSAQSDDIAALQTQVANLEIAPATQVPDEIDASEVHDLNVIIVLRSRPDEMSGDEIGDECAGAGRWSDLGPDTEVTISDADGTFAVGGSLASSEIVFSGQLFRECQLTFTLTDIPSVENYIVEIGDRSRLTLSRAELDVTDWTLDVSFGP